MCVCLPACTFVDGFDRTNAREYCTCCVATNLWTCALPVANPWVLLGHQFHGPGIIESGHMSYSLAGAPPEEATPGNGPMDCQLVRLQAAGAGNVGLECL